MTKLNQLELPEKYFVDFIIRLGKEYSFVSEADLKKFNKDKKYYIALRSLTIELHVMIEYLMEESITAYFMTSYEGGLSLYFKRSEFKENFMGKNMTFEQKRGVLNKIYKHKEKFFLKKIQNINEIRNAFAHGYSITDKRFFYFKKNIFSETHGQKLFDDMFEICDVLREQIKGNETQEIYVRAALDSEIRKQYENRF